jgi:hypothetical protein
LPDGLFDRERFSVNGVNLLRKGLGDKLARPRFPFALAVSNQAVSLSALSPLSARAHTFQKYLVLGSSFMGSGNAAQSMSARTPLS